MPDICGFPAAPGPADGPALLSGSPRPGRGPAPCRPAASLPPSLSSTPPAPRPRVPPRRVVHTACLSPCPVLAEPLLLPPAAKLSPPQDLVPPSGRGARGRSFGRFRDTTRPGFPPASPAAAAALGLCLRPDAPQQGPGSGLGPSLPALTRPSVTRAAASLQTPGPAAFSSGHLHTADPVPGSPLPRASTCTFSSSALAGPSFQAPRPEA